MKHWHRLVLTAMLLAVRPIAGGPPSPKGDEAARSELRDLERLAADPRRDDRKLWDGLVRFQRHYPTNPAIARVRQLLTQVRSPLDQLDPKQIPKSERFGWQPKGLVAVLGKAVRRHWGPVQHVAVSPDGKLIVSTSWDGLRLWEAASMREKLWLKGVYKHVAFAPDGKTLVVAQCVDRKSHIRLFGLEGDRLKPGLILARKDYNVCSLGFAPRGRTLMAHYWDDKPPQNFKNDVFVLWEWDKDGGKSVDLPRVRKADGAAACFSPDGGLFAHRTRGDALYLWAITKGGSRLWATLGGVRSFAWAPDGKTLVTCQNAATVRLTLWDMTGPQPAALGTFVTAKWWWGQLGFFPEGHLLVGRDTYGGLRLVDVAALRRHLAGKGPPPEPRLVKLPFGIATRRLCFSPDGRLLVFGAGDGTVRLWDVGKGVEHLPPPHPNLDAVGFLPDGRTLATVGVDRMLRLWDLGGARPKQKATYSLGSVGESYRFQFGPGGDILVDPASNGQQIRLWRLRGQRLEPLASFRVRDREYVDWAGFSPQGELLLAGFKKCEEGNQQPWLAVYQLEQGRKQPQRRATYLLGEPRQGYGTSVDLAPAFSADGRRVALPTRTSVFLWDWYPRRKQRASLRMDPKRPGWPCAMIWGMALSPDGEEIVTAGTEDVRMPDLLQLAGLHFWGLQGGQLKSRGTIQKEADNTYGPHGVDFVLGGKALLFTWDERYTLVDRTSCAKQWSWIAPAGKGQVTQAPDGRHVALSNANGTIYIVRLKEAAKPGAK